MKKIFQIKEVFYNLTYYESFCYCKIIRFKEIFTTNKIKTRTLNFSKTKLYSCVTKKLSDINFKRIISLELVVKLERYAESEWHFVSNKVKGRIWKRVFQIRTYVCVSGGKCSFFGKFGVLWDSFWDSPFLPYYRRLIFYDLHWDLICCWRPGTSGMSTLQEKVVGIQFHLRDGLKPAQG